jgi:trk system potassium uptake protein TrkH
MSSLVVLDFFTMGECGFREHILSTGITCFIGLSLFLASRSNEHVQISINNTFLLTTLLWCFVPFFASLPMYFHPSLHLSFIDVWFEATSLLTTTGFTMLKDADTIIPIIFWKLILCYIGGVGMVLMGMVILPVLRIGGMSLFRTESSEKSEKIMPHVSQIASRIVFIYTLAMVICFCLLKITGVSTLDAICHAVSSVSTCGLATCSKSTLGMDNKFAEFILLFAMFFGGSSLFLYIKIWKNGWRAIKEDPQIKGYVKIIVMFSVLFSVLLWTKCHIPFWESLRKGVFNTVAIITTTGLRTDDFVQFHSFFYVLLFVCSCIGGCTGSTSGGIKIMRIQVILASIKIHILQLRNPNSVFILTYKNQRVTDAVLSSVYGFIALYVMTIVVATFCLSFFDFDFVTCFSTAIAAVSNTGIGVGSIVGPGASITHLSLGPKVILMISMILGRLELLTILTLLAPSFWKKK